MDSSTRYHRAVAFIESFTNVVKSYTHVRHHHPAVLLRRTRAFLELIGNPDAQLRIIHITGTAGKGSVSTMIHEALVASGASVGLFTSPFATTTAEKFRVGNQLIGPDEFADIVEELKPAIDRAYTSNPHGGPSYFEICFAVALRFFVRARCEWAVCEVGCGGRYDATNVIRNPIATAITNIDLDHVEILGDTVTAIAHDKAGIIKRGSAFFTTEQRPQLLRLLRDTCTRTGAQFHAVQAPVEGRLRRAMSGPHQNVNAALAAAIARHIGCSERAIATGIASARLPCRFEMVQQRPMVVFDGAHSVVKMRSVASVLDTLRYRRCILVIGTARDKDVPGILRTIVPHADHIIATRFQAKERKCCPPATLARIATQCKKIGVSIDVRHDPHVALDVALHLAGPDDLVLVAGSFFLVGELRRRWVSEEAILAQQTSFPHLLTLARQRANMSARTFA